MSTKRDLPPIVVSDVDHDVLERFARRRLRTAMQPYPPVARLLAAELARAIVVPASKLRQDVVAIGTEVTYRDEATGVRRRVTLVHPGEEHAGRGRASVFSALGAALIGLSEGQSIRWRTASHGWSRLAVEKVHSRVRTGLRAEQYKPN
jgi:regulator of nucleoside diphosphate kinase